MADDSHMLLVMPTVSGSGHQDAGSSWSFDVATGEPFSLVATEFYGAAEPASARGVAQDFFKWAIMEHPAVSAPTTVDLDLDASPLTPSTASGSFLLPDQVFSGFFDMGRAYAQVKTFDLGSTLTLGFPTRIDVSEDGLSFEYEMEYVSPAIVQEPYWYYYLYSGERMSCIRMAGYPQDGAQNHVLPEPPVVVVGQTAPSIHGPIEWQLNSVDVADESLMVWLDVLGSEPAYSTPRWRLLFAPGTTSLELPELPTGVDPAGVFGGAAVGIQIITCDDMDPDSMGCERFSYSSRAVLTQ